MLGLVELVTTHVEFAGMKMEEAMGIFESKEDKQKRKDQEARAKLALYGLSDLSDPKDLQLALEIINGMTGVGVMETGIAIGGNNTNDILRCQLYYQSAVYKQNFLIIRQLDRIAKLLEEQSVEKREE